MVEENVHPDWVAGISIGAINSALTSLNPPENCLDKLRSFWEAITAASAWEWSANLCLPFSGPLEGRKYANQMDAASAMFTGVAGFFTPRMLSPWLQPCGGANATSYYDTTSLQTTIERLVDFDLINAGKMRFSVGAVNVRSGNFVFRYGNPYHTTRTYHGECSSAAGISRLSKSKVNIIGRRPCFQYATSMGTAVWAAPGHSGLSGSTGTRGESCRTTWLRSRRGRRKSSIRVVRDNTDQFTASQTIRHAVENLLKKLPNEMKEYPEVETLSSFGDQKVYSLVHLIYRAEVYEGDSKGL